MSQSLGVVSGIGFVWQKHFFLFLLFAAGANLIEALDGAGELPIKAGFVAIEDVEPAGTVAQGAIGERGLRGLVLVLVEIGFIADFMGECRGFEDPDAHQTPAANGHGLDESALGGCLGLKFRDQGIVEGIEAFGGFTVEDDGFGEQPVDEAVARGGKTAFRRDGPPGFGGVDSVRDDLTFGCHSFRLEGSMPRLGCPS
jgi:hypothetical protein